MNFRNNYYSRLTHKNERKRREPTTEKEENQENLCVVCFKGVEIYSIGQCDHPVCYECSTRMRVLCRQNECPICRQDMPTVVFTRNVRPFVDAQNIDMTLKDEKFNILFETEENKDAYEKLLAHNCPKCAKSFNTFSELSDHTRRSHQLTYCELCVENLMILTRERKCYLRHELTRHRRTGDPDDRSHRGHPLCVFCDKRYMDMDELYRHLRREHLFCHICDADDSHEYYSSYDFLRKHFRKEHFLCEEGNCTEEPFTSVFRTEIDLKAHKASAHGRTMNKAGLKQTRTLELEFTLAPRPKPSRNAFRQPRERTEDEPELGATGGSDVTDSSSMPQTSDFNNINTESTDQFPYLNNNNIGPVNNTQFTSQSIGKITIRSGRPLMVDDENFPALFPETTVSLQMNGPKSPQTNLSIQVNHRPSCNITTRVTTTTTTSHGQTATRMTSTHKNNLFEDDFPALSINHNNPLVSAVQWSSGKKIENKLSVISQKPLTEKIANNVKNPKNFNMENDFPSLTQDIDNLCSLNDHSGNSAWTVVKNNRSSNGVGVDGDLLKNSKKKKNKYNKTNGDNYQQSNKLDLNDGKNNKSKDKAKNVESTSKIKKKKSKSKKSSNNNNVDNNNIDVTECNDEECEENIDCLPCIESSVEYPSLMNSMVPPGFEPLPIVDSLPLDFEIPRWCPKPPPGLVRASSPPGLEKPVRNPPPGFTNTDNEAFPPLTSCILNGLSGSFITPSDFASRNNKLIERVKSIIGCDQLLAFKGISVRFQENDISALDYYNECLTILGEESFNQLFPELLALLPDIQKQQELWPLYESMSQTSEVKSKKGKNKNKNVLDVCATCRQVVQRIDLKEHLNSHAMENHFPSLSISNNATNINNMQWNKAK